MNLSLSSFVPGLKYYHSGFPAIAVYCTGGLIRANSIGATLNTCEKRNKLQQFHCKLLLFNILCIVVIFKLFHNATIFVAKTATKHNKTSIQALVVNLLVTTAINPLNQGNFAD